jgi:hypothetical protein
MHAAGLERPGTPHPDVDASTSTLYARANIEVNHPLGATSVRPSLLNGSVARSENLLGAR